MHVGYFTGFQNPGNIRTDGAVWAEELRLVDLAVDVGFDSIWAVEHHFSDYFLSPDPIQFLTWVGARHPHVGLGTAVIVLPWHEPLRCAEQLVVLDNLTGGRLTIGIGRGLGKAEYDGHRVDMETSRERFIAYAEMILGGLETGYLEADNEFIRQPRVEIRPRPEHSFRGRVYAAAMSPDAMPVMAKLGVGLMIIPQKPWETVRADIDSYQATWRDVHGIDVPPPAPLSSGSVIVDRDPERARELAHAYIGGYYHTCMNHYGFTQNAHAGIKGYEFYANVGKHVERVGADGAAADFVSLMPWGTPDTVLEKIQFMREVLGIRGFIPGLNYAAMTPDIAEANLRLFAAEVLPVLKTWEAEDIAVPEPFGALPVS